VRYNHPPRYRPSAPVSASILLVVLGASACASAARRSRATMPTTGRRLARRHRPWYRGQNGLVDLRVRVGAEFSSDIPGGHRSMRDGRAHWIFNARVDLDEGGRIAVLPATDGMNGNLDSGSSTSPNRSRGTTVTRRSAAQGYLKIAPISCSIFA